MATITEDYVSFETAKLLKEKGFSELTTKAYPYFEGKDYKYDISCPTLQIAMKWLREVHNLFIAFELDFSDGAYPMFDAVVYNLATCEKYPIINYDRYNYIKGTEAAIKYCLENLI